jgi:hypothetical protein
MSKETENQDRRVVQAANVSEDMNDATRKT